MGTSVAGATCATGGTFNTRMVGSMVVVTGLAQVNGDTPYLFSVAIHKEDAGRLGLAEVLARLIQYGSLAFQFEQCKCKVGVERVEGKFQCFHDRYAVAKGAAFQF